MNSAYPQIDHTLAAIDIGQGSHDKLAKRHADEEDHHHQRRVVDVADPEIPSQDAERRQHDVGRQRADRGQQAHYSEIGEARQPRVR